MRMHEHRESLLPLRRMAARLGVPYRWLRDQAKVGNVPGLKAGNRWLFVPDKAEAAVISIIEAAADRAIDYCLSHPMDDCVRVFGSMDHPMVQWMKDRGFNVVHQSEQRLIDWAVNLPANDDGALSPIGGDS